MKRAAWVASTLALLISCNERVGYFTHAKHLAELDCGSPGKPRCLACTSCHTSPSAKNHQGAPPTRASCQGCHAEDTSVWEHSVRPKSAAQPAAKSIPFPHDQHLELKGLKGQCVKCHAGAVGSNDARPLFPPMATCLGCHEHEEQFAKNQCTPCHRPQDLRGLVPTSFLRHDVSWGKRHGSAARNEGKRCETCHAQTFCDTCHDSTLRLAPQARAPDRLTAGFAHRFDVLQRHPLEARSNPGLCTTCHQRQECDACHVQRGVSAQAVGAPSPHPFGWASGTATSNNGHGLAARRDLASCAACHDQGAASVCVRCHKVGGTGGSPHPPSFPKAQPMTGMCLVCHGGTP